MVTMSIDKKYDVITDKELSSWSLYEKQRVLIDLLTQLATVLNEKTTLERENSNLKLEKQRLIQKYLDLERDVKLEKKTWMKDVIDSQIKVQEKETRLAKKDIERLEEQKLSMLEINNLKLSFYEQRESYEAREVELFNEIKALKVQIHSTDNVFNNLKSNAEVNYNKYVVYKRKVKYAVSAIRELMQEVQKYKKPVPEVEHEACQTDTVVKESSLDKTCKLNSRNQLCKVCWLINKEFNFSTPK